jgi:hypothetical protein
MDLLTTRDDLLGGCTCSPEVSQRSEAGKGIMGTKTGKGMLLCMLYGDRLFVDYETIKRKLNRKLIYECRCDERLKAKAEGSTRLTYTGFHGGLEHLKIVTRLINESFASVMGECMIVTLIVFQS